MNLARKGSPSGDRELKKSARASVSRNICANFLGRGVLGLLGVFFVPLYTRMIGIESLGILGLFVSLQGVLSILDLGLSATVNRELAIGAAGTRDVRQSRDLVRTLEWVFWTMALAIAITLAALAPLISHWVNAKALTPGMITSAGLLLAAQLAVQFPQSLYSGGLQGLEKQVLLNTITSLTNIARHVGVLLPLWLIKPDIIVFVSWQIGVVAIGVLVTRWMLWRSLPAENHAPHFSTAALKRVRQFSLGVGATTIVTIPLMTLDKLIMSRILPLETYGYYMLAWQGATGLGFLVVPFFSAFFPRFTSVLNGPGGERSFNEIYTKAYQMLSLVLAPAAACVILFAQPLTSLWLHSNGAQAAAIVAPLLAVLVAGSYFNGLMHLPHAVCLAKGKSHFAFFQNVLSLFFYLPLIYLLTVKYGAIGSAACWLILNGGCVVVSAFILHRWFMPGQFAGWIKHAVMLPSLVAFGIASVCYLLMPPLSSLLASSVFAGFSFCLGIIALALVLPECRAFLRNAGASLRARDALRQ